MINVENLQFGVMTALTGIIIVMGVLIIISLVLGLFEIVSKKAGENKIEPEKKDTAPLEQKPLIENIEPSAEDVQEADDTELIAVLAAAVAASMNTSADRIVVHSVRRSYHWRNNTVDRANRTYF